MTPDCDVLVVGGGAAGCIAAGTAAKRGQSVLLLEKNARLGRKVLITGKGRCNLTNNCSAEEFLAAVKTGEKFLYSAIHRLTPQDVMELFEGLGVALKTERGRRVFPVSDRSVDIVDALERYVRQNGVQLLHTGCVGLLTENGQAVGVQTSDGRKLYAGSVVLATGGLSYPKTGSTGDGYRFAREVGHSIVPTGPSLIPIVTNEDWCSRLMGLSLRNVTMRLWQDGMSKPLFEELGEMLFTHFGISGPLVLSASAHMRQSQLKSYRMELDLKPALDEKQLDERLLRDFSKFANRDFSNSLYELLPQKLIPVVVELSGIPAHQKVHQLRREQREQLCWLIKHLTVTPRAFRPIEEAVVTAGGVDTREVNPKTMESKLMKGLYFAGELLDLDAYTGGFNLQIAFCTGYAAGQNA